MDRNDIAWAIDAALENAERRARRERIATAALTGLIAQDAGGGGGRQWWFAANDPVGAAKAAVQLADALIAELDKPKGGGL